MIGIGEEPSMCRKREEEIYWKIVDGFKYGSRSSELKLIPSPIFGLLNGTKTVNLLTRTSVELNFFFDGRNRNAKKMHLNVSMKF